jgi:hypothetical protein
MIVLEHVCKSFHAEAQRTQSGNQGSILCALCASA